MDDQPLTDADTIVVGGDAMSEAAPEFDPMLLSVLSSRFGAILREMSNGVLRASKSGVIKIARDMSCAILTYDHRLVCIEECIPVHAAAIDLTTRPLTAFFDDIEEGDAFLNNCPYTGVTHHADLTLCVPVFFDGKPLFWTVSRAHHADVGAPIPSTYLPYAKTIYEEGLHFPGVRVERGYKELRDIIRMARMKVRVPDLWYGDYLAQVGACRTAERRIVELVEKYGPETIARNSSRPGWPMASAAPPPPSGRCRPARGHTRTATIRCRASPTTGFRCGRPSPSIPARRRSQWTCATISTASPAG